MKTAERRDDGPGIAPALSLLESIYRHADDCIVILDCDFRYLHVNRAYAAVCARQTEEFSGRLLFDFHPSPLTEEFRRAAETRTPYAASDHPFVFADRPDWGETYWDLSLVPVPGDADAPNCSAGRSGCCIPRRRSWEPRRGGSPAGGGPRTGSGSKRRSSPAAGTWSMSKSRPRPCGATAAGSTSPSFLMSANASGRSGSFATRQRTTPSPDSQTACWPRNGPPDRWPWHGIPTGASPCC